MFNYLATAGEKGLASGVHKHHLAPAIGLVVVDSEGEVALQIKDREATAGEQKGLPPHSQDDRLELLPSFLSQFPPPANTWQSLSFWVNLRHRGVAGVAGTLLSGHYPRLLLVLGREVRQDLYKF